MMQILSYTSVQYRSTDWWRTWI